MKRLFAFSWFILLVLVSACARPDQAPAAAAQPANSEKPENGDWLILRYEAEPDNLNRAISTSSYSQFIMDGANGSGIGEHLLRFNTTDWTFSEPLLAESLPDISDNHLQYTFSIRDGVKWHDGRLLTTDDVVFSVKALMCPFSDSAQRRAYFTEIANVESLEGRQVRFTFNKPYYMNLFDLGFILPIMPKHIYDPDGLLDKISLREIVQPDARNNQTLKKFGEQFNKNPANRAPIGTGPYKFEKWDSGKEVVLVRNKDYWGDKPHLDKIIIRFIEDETAALTALKSGDLDFNPRMQPIQYVEQTAATTFEQQFAKATYTIPSFSFITWNEQRPFFKDKRVRQALTMLINREQFVQSVLFGFGKLTDSYFPPDSPEYNANVKPFPYDPVHASQLLDEAGWVDHDGDGIRDKDGIPFKFEFLGSANNRIVDQLLPVLKEEFRKAGIAMTERRLEFAVMIEQLKDKQYDASFLGWVLDMVADPFQIWHSRSIDNRGSNYGSFSSPEADQLMEKARVEFDPDRRRQIYGELQEIIHQEQPFTMMYIQERPAAYHRRFQNVKWLASAPGYDLLSWFVPKSAQRFGETQP